MGNTVDGTVIVVLVVAAVIILWLWSRTSALTEEVRKAQAEVARLASRVQQEAMTQFQKWRHAEHDSVKRQEAEVAERASQVKLAEWKASSEMGIRADAIQRSQSVIIGKVSEHIVPHLPEFTYNPKDARFVGSPVDFVVFDGLDAGYVEQVVFIEVKTGTGALTKRERHIRDAVVAKRVTWQEMRLASPRAATDVSTAAASTPSVNEETTIYTCSECFIQNTVRLEDLGRRTVRCGFCESEVLASNVAPGVNNPRGG